MRSIGKHAVLVGIPRPAGGRGARWHRVEAWTFAIAVAFVLAFAVIAGVRLFYPFEVSWMESATYEMMLQRLQGRSIYAPPSLAYTPCLYPPLYFDVSAGVARALGFATTISFLPMRLVSILASSALFALTSLLVFRKGASQRWSFAVGAIFLASYGRFECWQDNSRVDSLYCLLLVAGTALLLEGRALGSAFVAGVAFGAAILTKQPAAILMTLALARTFLAERTVHRVFAAVSAAASTVVGYLAVVGELGNPMLYHYLFTIPASHPLEGRLFVRGLFFLPVTLPFLCVAIVAALHGDRNAGIRALAQRAPWTVVLVLWVAATLPLRAKHGASINFFLPLIPVASLAAVESVDRLARRASRLTPLLQCVPAAQLLFLAYDPRPFLPTQEDAREAAVLVDRLRDLDGPVWFPAFPSYAAFAGKPWFAQEIALADLAQVHPGLVDRELGAEIDERTFGGVIVQPRAKLTSAAGLASYRLEALPIAESRFLSTLHLYHLSAGVLTPPVPPALPRAAQR